MQLRRRHRYRSCSRRGFSPYGSSASCFPASEESRHVWELGIMQTQMAISMHSGLSLNYVLHVPTRKADKVAMPLVVLLHGRGGDANDLADLAPPLDGPGGSRFVLPNAPRPFEPVPGMAYGLTWFDGWPPARGSADVSRQSLLRFLEEIWTPYPWAG